MHSESPGARMALGIEYDGSAFNGWQVQPDARTVQQVVEAALGKVAASEINTICAGRTDSGVHAICQVVHFDSPSEREEDAWRMGANANLPPDVAVSWARRVDSEFSARFGALARQYSYLILNRQTHSPIYRQRACWERRPLDIGAMNDAAAALVGEHDFSAFRSAACQAASAQRIVNKLSVERCGPWVRIDIEANAFLQNMVRIVAGVLLRVGRGDAPARWVGEILASADRGHRGETAPAHGLYLTAVRYPARYGLPDPPDLAEFLPGG